MRVCRETTLLEIVTGVDHLLMRGTINSTVSCLEESVVTLLGKSTSCSMTCVASTGVFFFCVVARYVEFMHLVVSQVEASV